MTIAICLNRFAGLTGSELYVYDLARVLRKRGHTPAILAADIGGEIARRAKALGIPVHPFFDHPTLHPDLLHVQQPSATGYALAAFPNVPAVATSHSTLPFESPVDSPRIRRFIAVRPSIKRHLADHYGITRTSIVYNGLDTSRFNQTGATSPEVPTVLFVGTWDHLREEAIGDLLARAKKEGFKVILCGDGMQHAKVADPIVAVYPPRWDIEALTKHCTKTAGILLGRTTIEGWLCGKDGYIYVVDNEGRIREILETTPPANPELFFDATMADQTLAVYEEALA